jgi:hypothetical protein
VNLYSTIEKLRNFLSKSSSVKPLLVKAGVPVPGKKKKILQKMQHYSKRIINSQGKKLHQKMQHYSKRIINSHG